MEIFTLMSQCSSPVLASILSALKKILTLIQIIIPIILIITLAIKLIKMISHLEDKKTPANFKNTLIAILLVFFIPTLINYIINMVDDSYDFEACLKSTSDPENKKVEIPSTNPSPTPRPSPPALNPDAGGGEIDGSCYAEYENGIGYARIVVDTNKVSGSNYKIINAGAVVQEGTATAYQSSNLYDLLIHPSIEVTLPNGETKKAECEVKHSTNLIPYGQDGYYFSKGATKDRNGQIDNPYPGAGISYYIYVPKGFNTDTQYPVVLALHGGYGYGVSCKGSVTSEGNQTYHFLKSALYKNKYPINNVPNADVNAIVIAPSNMTCGWEGSSYKALDILHTFIKLYNVDIDRIVVTGTSQGGYGTLYSGFLEEQIIYKAIDNNTTLDSVAKMYNTTADEVKKYNKSLKINISYSDNGTKLKAGSYTIIKPKSEEGMRGLFSVLVPMSPAKNLTRCIFTPSTIYDKSGNCNKTPIYTLKTPIWVISSNDEYDKIQQFAKELTAYYEQNGDIRYTVLSNIKTYYKTNAHNTQIPILGYTNAFDWMISQEYGSVTTKNNTQIDDIEKQLGQAFVKDFHP